MRMLSTIRRVLRDATHRGGKSYTPAYEAGYVDGRVDATHEISCVIASVTGCDVGSPDDTPLDRFADVWQTGIGLAKRIGETNGYRCGREAGRRVGQREQKKYLNMGYDNGHSDGCQDGYEVGHSDGYDLAADEALDQWARGHTEGHADGCQDGWNGAVDWHHGPSDDYPTDPLAPPTSAGVNSADWKDGYDAAQAERCSRLPPGFLNGL